MGGGKDPALENDLIFINKQVLFFLNIKFVLYYMNVYTILSLCELALKSLGL